MRTTFASGAWVEHRPIQDLKVKDADAVSSAMKMLMPMTEDGELDLSGGIALGGEMQVKTRNAVIARIVTAWSYDLPVPEWANHEIQHEESIGELPIDDGNELAALIAPYQAKLRSRPNPPGGTTSSSNGVHKASPGRSRRA